MTPVSLLGLALLGVAVAALPLLYVWRSRDPQRFRKLAWVTAFLTLDLIMVGSFTRLTDSGLGCPDWPGCYGHSNPLSAGEQIQQAETELGGAQRQAPQRRARRGWRRQRCYGYACKAHSAPLR